MHSTLETKNREQFILGFQKKEKKNYRKEMTFAIVLQGC